MPIILASASPRRKELFSKLVGKNFSVIPSDYEEIHKEKDPKKLVIIHSRNKARDVARCNEGIIIGVDTVVFFERHILGKPKDKHDAQRMLKLISGKTVSVITGVTIIDTEKKKEISDFEISKVKIKKLTDRQIKDYVKTKEPLDKAGAFAIQGKGAFMIEWIKGDYGNVVGLPLGKLKLMLVEFDISLVNLMKE